MKNGWPSTPLYKSAGRLQEGELQLKSTKNRVWFAFLKKESSIMLRRAIGYWFKIRFRRGAWRKLLLDSD
ncbi:hypothetical protein LCGC14_0732830 [marine sediment metagenome]|uniref:Uncharacterized protein n=1 Tax=marine sediment metagenome TaxID=412755 RepID=A0A0F9QD69_9ZZZZ